MGPGAWDEGIGTGIESIDAEHRLQVTLVNALDEQLRRGSDRSLTSRTLDQLVEFTAVHFLSEELIMRLYGYPHHAAHQAEHGRLTEQVTETRSRIDRGNHADALVTIATLHTWLTAHIRTLDQAFASWCSANRIVVR